MEGRMAGRALAGMFLAGLGATDVARADWHSLRHDLQRSGWTDAAGALTRPAIASRVDVGGVVAGASAVRAVDIDGNGRRELLIAAAGRVTALSSGGQVFWDTPPLGILSIVGVSDLDADGAPEIVTGGKSLIVLSLAGEVVWSSSASGASSYSRDNIRIADLDQDGTDELVVAPFGLPIVQVFDFAAGFGANDAQNLLWQGQGLGPWKSLTIADADANGRLDVVVSSLTNRGLRIFDALGQVVADRPGYSYSGPSYTLNLDDDPQLETVAFGTFGTFAGTFVRVWDPIEASPGGHMAELWLASPPAQQRPPAFPIVDLDGDGNLEIVTTFWDGTSWRAYVLRYVESGDAGARQGELQIVQQWVNRVLGGTVDLDRDGVRELILSNTLPGRFQVPPFGTVRAVVYDRGVVTERWQISGAALVTDQRDSLPWADVAGRSGITVQDVDSDGRDEIYLSRDLDGDARPDELIALNGDSLTVAARLPITGGLRSVRVLRAGDHIAGPTSAAETILIDSDGKVQVLDHAFVPIGPPLHVGGFAASIAVADLDADGTPEVLASTSAGVVLALAGETLLNPQGPQIEFSYYGGVTGQTTTQILPIDTPEGAQLGVVLRSQDETGSIHLTLLDPRGAVVAESSALVASPQELLAGDFHPAPGHELLVTYTGADSPHHALYGIEGSELVAIWDTGGQAVADYFAAADVDGDGYLDYYYRRSADFPRVQRGANSAVLGVLDATGKGVPLLADYLPGVPGLEMWHAYADVTEIHTLRFDGGATPDAITDVLVARSAPLAPLSFWGAVYVDVDGDGALDAVMPSRDRNQLQAVSAAAGATLWRTWLVDGIAVTEEADGRRNDVTLSQASGADLDGDGAPEVVTVSSDGYLYAVDATSGAIEWSLPLESSSPQQVEPVIADLDGDGSAELLVSTDDGLLQVLVDAKLETPGEVREVNVVDPSVDLDEWESTTELSAAWEPVPGAQGYRVALVTTNGSRVVPWTDVGAATSWSFTSLGLVLGSRYAISLQPYGVPGEVGASADSDGVIVVDVSAPTLEDLTATPVVFNPVRRYLTAVTGRASDPSGLFRLRLEAFADEGASTNDVRWTFERNLVGRITYDLDETWYGLGDDGAVLEDGVYTVRATVTDVGAHVASATTIVVLDSLPPAAPVIVGPAPDALLATARPDVAGVVEPGATVLVVIDDSDTEDSDSEPACVAIADGDGSFACSPWAPIDDGVHTATAEALDAAGNLSERAIVVAFTVDTVAPPAPRIDLPADGTQVLDPSALAFSGTATGDTEQVEVAAVDGPLCTSPVAAGTWSCTPARAPEPGPFVAAAFAVDRAGNRSGPSAAVRLTLGPDDDREPDEEPDDEPDDQPGEQPSPVVYPASGCSCGGAGAPLWPLVLAAWTLRRRRARSDRAGASGGHARGSRDSSHRRVSIPVARGARREIKEDCSLRSVGS